MKKFIYNQILGVLIKKGRKSLAKKFLDKALFLVSIKTHFSIFKILKIMNENLKIFVEAKEIIRYKKKHYIPYTISIKRQSCLLLKWFLNSINEKNSKISIEKKLAEEILSIINQSETSLTLLKINSNNNW